MIALSAAVMPRARECLENFNLMTICLRYDSACHPPLPGLPSQHPRREPLRQIGEDYCLSQGPHWEHWEDLSSTGEMTSTHPLCMITAGRAESELGSQAG